MGVTSDDASAAAISQYAAGRQKQVTRWHLKITTADGRPRRETSDFRRQRRVPGHPTVATIILVAVGFFLDCVDAYLLNKLDSG